VTCHAREKKYGHRTPPSPCVPTEERLRRFAPSPLGGAELFSEQGPGIVVVVPYRVPQCPLPSRGDGLFSEQGPVIVVVVS